MKKRAEPSLASPRPLREGGREEEHGAVGGGKPGDRRTIRRLETASAARNKE